MLEVRRVRYRKGNRWATRYIGVLGHGTFAFEGPPAESAKAARQAVLEAAGQVLNGELAPRFYRFPSNPSDYYLVVWRDRYAWGYTILFAGLPRESNGRVWGDYTGVFKSAEEAERAGRRHLAQIMADPSTGYSAVEVIENEQDRAEHLRLFEWDGAWRQAKQAGLSDEQARNAADLHQDRKLPIEQAIELARQGYSTRDRLPAEA